MNRNEIIGTLIGKAAGYTVQGYVISAVAKSISPPTAIAVKVGAKSCITLIKYTSKYYSRTDFSSETIFSDAIDASFFAD